MKDFKLEDQDRIVAAPLGFLLFAFYFNNSDHHFLNYHYEVR